MTLKLDSIKSHGIVTNNMIVYSKVLWNTYIQSNDTVTLKLEFKEVTLKLNFIVKWQKTKTNFK